MKKNIKNIRNIHVLVAIKLKGGFFKNKKKEYKRDKKINIDIYI